MQKLQLSGERVHLLQKVAKKERDPLEILACTVFAVLLFLWVYLFTESKMRHEESAVALLLGPGVALALCSGLTYYTYKKLKSASVFERRNLWVNLTVCSWCALVAGYLLGDHSFWKYTTNIYSYRDLVSYVDIDPFTDKGQAYMDSGHVYFKETSYVLRQKFTKFKNADVYCAAPIVRGNFKAIAGAAGSQDNVNGNVIPSSGTYDWWAVGVNCCDGDHAANFTCGDVDNRLARSGMRLLSDNQRPYYVLAVQEWSATYGLPVKHPLFFTWVKDPLETEVQWDFQADDEMWRYTWYAILFAFLLSFILHMVMHQNKIY